MTDLPVVVTAAGPQPQQPAAILAALLALVSATNPGYTANLPGSLIEDISSTDVGAILLCDSAAVELINSLTPFGSNPFLTAQLGGIYGVPLGQESNTSVNVQFTGPPGFVIAQGFTVGDGTYQYTLSDGGIIGAGGVSPLLFALATVPGSWPVPAGTVQNLVTPPPTGVTLSVINPQPGTPGEGAESEEAYRARVLQAGLAVGQGMSTFLKTLLNNVNGVQSRLVSVRQVTGGGWVVLVGGGDPYEVAYAIYTALFDISALQGSVLSVVSITKANPGVVTTDLNHGFATGQTVLLTGVLGMTQVNNVPKVATVINEKQFSIGDTSAFGTYTSGGTITPNLRNIVVTVQDYPDTYQIPFVDPPQQSVSISVLWNTSATNFVSSAAVAQLANPALVDYVNTIPVGVPINLFELQTVFQEAVASILPPQLLTRMVFTVSINGIGTTPSAGTGIIAGDPESYFLTSSTQITIAQG